MLKIPYEDILYKIEEKSGLAKTDIEKRITDKLAALHGLVSKEGAAHIVANELGVRVLEQTSGKLDVKSLISGMRDVELHGTIARVYDVREFSNEKRTGKVGSLLIGDTTGVVRIVLWNEIADRLADLKEGTGLIIKGGLVKERNGFKEVHLNERSTLEPTDSAPAAKKIPDEFERKRIGELSETDSSVELLGTIVQVFDLKFFEICPQCSKRAKPSESGFFCERHGSVTPSHTAVMNIFLDDGSESMRIVFFRRQLQRLLGIDEPALLALRDNPLGFDLHRNNLLGSMLKVSGRVVKNPLFDRLELIASLVYLNPDPGPELERLQSQKKQAEQIKAPPTSDDEEPSTTSEDVHIHDDNVLDE